MKKEKIILSFTAALIGIVAAIGVFFFYQETKKIKSSEIKKITILNPSPTPASSVFITLSEPSDEQVFDKRIIKISGKTVPNARVVILTQNSEEAAIAASNGNFSTEITLGEGQNILDITSVGDNGEIAKVKRVITYSTEDF
ncbi:MAG: hypothetical protein AAB520_01740 [Patescibacteria group bacterium]